MLESWTLARVRRLRASIRIHYDQVKDPLMHCAFELVRVLVAVASAFIVASDVLVERDGSKRECHVVSFDESVVKILIDGTEEIIPRENVSSIQFDSTAGSPSPGIDKKPDAPRVDASTGHIATVIGQLIGHTNKVRSVAFSARSDLLVSGGEGAQCIVWSVGTRKSLNTIPRGYLSDEVTDVRFVKVGSQTVVAAACRTGWANGFGSKRVSFVVDQGKKTERALFFSVAAARSPTCIAVDDSSRFLVAAGEDGILHCLDMKKVLQRVSKEGASSELTDVTIPGAAAAPSGIGCMAFCSRGPAIYAGLSDGSIAVFDIDTKAGAKLVQGKAIAEAHGKAVTCICCSAGGDILYSGSDDATVTAWNTADGSRCGRVDLGSGVESMAIDERRSMIAIGCSNGSILFLNAKTLATLGTERAHTKSVTALAFDADGQQLASGSEDTQVLLWKINEVAKK